MDATSRVPHFELKAAQATWCQRHGSLIGLWAAFDKRLGRGSRETPAASLGKMRYLALVALGHVFAFAVALGGAAGDDLSEWDTQALLEAQLSDETLAGKQEIGSKYPLRNVRSRHRGSGTASRAKRATPGVSTERSNASKSHPGGATPVRPLWQRAANAVERHRALVVAVLLGTALLLRALQLGTQGTWSESVQDAKKELLERRKHLEEKKVEVAKMRKELKAVLRRTAKKDGVLERRKLDLQERTELLQLDETVLRDQEKKVDARMSAVILLERKAVQAQVSLLEKAKATAREMGSQEDAEQTEVLGSTEDVSERLEAELAVFDVPACAVRREREKTALLREYLDLAKMRAALAVLRELPAYPSTVEEAKDILRARRMLMGAVVRFQSSVWSAIQTLLEKKGELQAEMVIAEARKDGVQNLKRLAEAEWDVKALENQRTSKALEDLEGELEECMSKQAELTASITSQEGVTPEEIKNLRLELFKWENYEVTLRARKAQLTYAGASAFTTKSAFLRQRQRRIQNAKDSEAERRMRLPSEALRAAELESMISAISEELKDMGLFFSMARDVREAYEAQHPDVISEDKTAE